MLSSPEHRKALAEWSDNENVVLETPFGIDVPTTDSPNIARSTAGNASFSREAFPRCHPDPRLAFRNSRIWPFTALSAGACDPKQTLSDNEETFPDIACDVAGFDYPPFQDHANLIT